MAKAVATLRKVPLTETDCQEATNQPSIDEKIELNWDIKK